MLTTNTPITAVIEYLREARKFHSQASVAKQLGVDARTVRRWETNQSQPPAYLSAALQQMLPFHITQKVNAEFDFIDLFDTALYTIGFTWSISESIDPGFLLFDIFFLEFMCLELAIIAGLFFDNILLIASEIVIEFFS